MELISFSVRNFRSITDAHKINFKDYTVLIGKNNEGKSNILKALSICMSLINEPLETQRRMRSRNRFLRNNFYNWERDFPIVYQNRKNGLKTIFVLEFSLEEEELIELNELARSKFNSRDLTVRIEIGPNNTMEIKLPKKGTNSLNNKSVEIMKYISSKITYNYIPARRQERDTVAMIENSISKEFSLMEENEEYKTALDTIRKLQMEKLEKISTEVKPVLKEFIPNIKDVKIEFAENYNYNRILDRDIEIMIDDGNLTNIEYKGDGIKSLMSLAMLRNRTHDKTMSIIAIDEPEAHLHPGAMNELSKTLKKLSEDNQLIISTHNALFMNKEDIKNNIIVNAGEAKKAKNIHKIRELLGIKMSDNLMCSEYILLVEGESDKVILNKIFCIMSDKIKKLLNDGTFTIYSIGGASKLSYNLHTFNSQFCKCYTFMDYDLAGKNSTEKEIREGEIELKNTTLCICKGMPQSEIEDCINPEIYVNMIKEDYSVDLQVREFRNNKIWNVRMKETFNSQGQVWDNEQELQIKEKIANIIDNTSRNDFLIEEKSSSILALIKKLEESIKF